MPVFAISFRIGDTDTTYGTYDERWKSVTSAIQLSTASSYWDETTSFLIIEADNTASGVAGYIDKNSTFDATVDLLVCINLSQKGYSVLGNYRDKDIDVLMKKR